MFEKGEAVKINGNGFTSNVDYTGQQGIIISSNKSKSVVSINGSEFYEIFNTNQLTPFKKYSLEYKFDNEWEVSLPLKSYAGKAEYIKEAKESASDHKWAAQYGVTGIRVLEDNTPIWTSNIVSVGK